MTVALAPPPPVHVPPPEVRIARPQPAPTITATPVEPPYRPVIVPTAPATVAAAPAPVRAPVSPPAPPPRPAKPARIDMASCDKPDYPRAALRAGATGTTRIQFAIDPAGRVMRASLVKPSGSSFEHRRMDRAAVEALSRCAFEPGVDEKGRAVGADATVEYVWRLDD
jgi:protein TonB